MDVRMKEFLDKVNYMNWVWSLGRVGVPMRITFAIDKPMPNNKFCKACMDLFDGDADTKISRIKVNQQGDVCTMYISMKCTKISDKPSKDKLYLSGERYDAAFKQLTEFADELHSLLINKAKFDDIRVDNVLCDFEAIECIINWHLTKRVYDAISWVDAHELSVPVSAADLTYNRVPVWDEKIGEFRVIKPIFQLNFTPNSETQPTRGSVTVRVEHPMCTDPDSEKSLRTAITKAVSMGVEVHNLEIENTFIYLGD